MNILDNYKTWGPEPGMTQLKVSNGFISDAEFPAFLHRMSEQLAIFPNKHLQLIFTSPLSETQMLQLATLIHAQAEIFPFDLLSLRMDENSLQSEAFKILTKVLNATNIQMLDINLDGAAICNAPDAADQVADLLSPCAEYVHYPIIAHSEIQRATDESIPYLDEMMHSNKMNAFKRKILQNMRAHNSAKLNADLTGETYTPADLVNLPAAVTAELESASENAAKIKMKNLIQQSNARNTAFDKHIKLEVNHVDVQQQEQQQQIEQVAQHVVEEDTQELEIYSGDKIGYNDFLNYYNGVDLEYHYLSQTKLFRNELFGNMPQAIKYITPAVMQAIFGGMPHSHWDLLNDQAAFASINAHNVPQNFIIKTTVAGELVLDYDLYAPDKQTNVYTPRSVTKHTRYNYFNLHAGNLESEMYAWVKQDFTAAEQKNAGQLYALDVTKYTNIWLKFGKQCIDLVNSALENCEKAHPGMFKFIMRNYIAHFKHWDSFFENANFIRSMEKISKYTPEQSTCLQKFLKDTGASQHDLQYTLAAFDDFWQQWLELAAKNNLKADAILVNWTTPEGGNPIIYMERLLTILKNSRDLKEQCECIDGIELNNYGAYYASKYEGFKLVSKEMDFKYDPEQQNTVAFNRNMKVHRVDLPLLLEFVNTCGIETVDTVNRPWGYYARIISDKASKNNEITEAEFIKLKEDWWKVTRLKSATSYLSDQLYFVDDISLVLRQSTGQQGNVYLQKIHCIESLTLDKYLNKANRIIGQQSKSIALKKYTQAISNLSRKLDKDCSVTERSLDLQKPRITVAKAAVTALYFVAHERYLDQTKFDDLLQMLYEAGFSNAPEKSFGDGSGPNNLDEIQHLLNKLYSLGVNLSPAEGLVILKGLDGPREGSVNNRFPYLDENALDKLAIHLRLNKYAAIKFLKYIALEHKDYTHKERNTFYSYNNTKCIDKADFLTEGEDGSKIVAAYGDDLLLFGAMLVFDWHKMPQPHDIKDELQHFAKIKPYFSKAASSTIPNNLDTALKYLFTSKQQFGYAMFFAAFEEIDRLTIEDEKAVEQILIKNNFALNSATPDVLSSPGESLKMIMIAVIINLRKSRAQAANSANIQAFDETAEYTRLAALEMPELQKELKQAWPIAGTIITAVAMAALAPLITLLKNQLIDDAFAKLGDSKLAKLLAKKIHDLPDFGSSNDFDRAAYIGEQAQQLSTLLAALLEREECSTKSEEYIKLFDKLKFSHLSHAILVRIFAQLDNMPQREHLPILQALFAHKVELYSGLVDLIKQLDNNGWPTSYIIKLINTAGEVGTQAVAEFVADAASLYATNNDDPLLRWMLNTAELKFATLQKIAALTKAAEQHREAIQKLFTQQANLPSNLSKLLDAFDNISADKAKLILEMIARSAASDTSKTTGAVDYIDLVQRLNKLDAAKLAALHKFYATTTPGATCLYARFKQYTDGDFPEFLASFEKAPFGDRDFTAQFDTTQVERIVNGLVDLSNTDAAYTYSYRKHLMEAFLFVNSAGKDLPIYANLPAKDLTNQQILDLFQSIKNPENAVYPNVFANLDPMQRRLYALALMREAMYRATGQFPYSTQILGLIDCIMHEGDVISNIDTGQGKSLIDTMKAGLLWLESDRVDISTSSMVDAKRDLEIYAPFLNLLGITHASSAISATTDSNKYAANGINYSTLAQLALFNAKLKGEGKTIGKSTDRVSLVMNESDFSILDDKTIYRYASTADADVGVANEWIYYAINQFVQGDKFKANNTSAATDIKKLIEHLQLEAKKRNKSAKILQKFDEKQLLTWLESAILVNYRLRQDFDYVVTLHKEEKLIRGEVTMTHLVKVLMQDGKVSPDTQFGNGVQQLLCAKLNMDRKREDFILEPESKTIISLNNRNMIDFYRSKKGFIWGSSGTVGNAAEIKLQYQNYGFEFSKLLAHQIKQIKQPQPRIYNNEQQQFAALISALSKDHGRANAPPALVFFKDIETAKRFYAHLDHHYKGRSMQIYTGMGDEPHIIQKAATPGMITVTTAALGRNTDIPYNKTLGMTVYQTFIDTTRKADQRTGRTGRQGSPGTVRTLLNLQDIPAQIRATASVQSIAKQTNKLIAATQAFAENKAKQDREFNERFYNILNCFASQADLLPVAVKNQHFYTVTWAQFSAFLEERYRELNLNGKLHQSEFIDLAVEKFNLLIDGCTHPDDLNSLKLTTAQIEAKLAAQYPDLKKLEPYHAAISMQDCTPAHVFAYKYLKAGAGTAAITETEVKAKLKAIFASRNNSEFITTNNDYIKYLNSGAQLSSIRKWHQEAISDFLHSNGTDSSNNKTKKRWLGVAGHLNTIVSNENYLLLFKALNDVPGDALQTHEICSVLRTSICSLIDEYLQHSWFISAYKRSQMTELKQAIENAGTVADLINSLATVKSTVIDEDVRLNNLPLYKRPKSVNLSGQSRLQTTLDNALALTAAVTGQDVQQEYLNELNAKLSNSIKHSTAPVAVENLDAFKLQQSLFHYRDRQKNAAVIGRSIEKILRRKPVVVHGMTGRKSP